MRVGIIEPVSYGTDDERALATLGRLTRGALHELSNPLVALLGSAELALVDAEPGTKLHDRIALTQRTGAEVVEIVRALQGFIRLQSHPPEELSVGAAAADAVALVERVLPTHDVELRASGDARTVVGPGEIRRRLVELLLDALDAPGRGPFVELVVAAGVVTATGGGELRL
jgi:signal transduction histidine kinase